MTILRRLWPAGLFGALACLFLWKVVFAGQVFVPAQLLRYLAPWTAEPRPPWNPLMYDSVGQFYPWRHFAAETVRSGTIPLWNPYQFCGTPFVANSQSAVFYPGNLLFYLLPTAYAAGWSVILHLFLAGAFTYLFLRGVDLTHPAAVFGGIAFAFCTWQVSWLHLPTFLATSCWLPLVLHATFRLRQSASPRRAVLLSFAVGMTLLAGHLQIAFYVLLAAGLLAVWPGIGQAAPLGTEPAPRRLRWPRFAAIWLVAVLVGGLLSMPQVLPSLELSRHSHRVGPATAEGYAGYVGYSATPATLATLFLPDFFGNPSNPDNPYVGKIRRGEPFNYAEGAMYVGMPTLLLAALGLLEARRRSRVVGYSAALAVLAMLMALGTSVDALFYFYVPGFAQSGSPGRVLVLWSFALSVMAAFGCDAVVRKEMCTRGLLGSLILVAAVFGLTAAAGMTAMDASPPGLAAGVGRAVTLLLLTSGAALLVSRRSERVHSLMALPAIILVVDLFATGIGYNPTASSSEVYPATPLITELQKRSGHDRIMPVNRGNFSFAGPSAVMPPNGAMVFGLRDVQGYDSLFPGQYKRFMDEIAAPVDPDYKSSPLQVGNMIFAKNPASPLVPVTGTRLLVSREQLGIANERFIEGIYVSELPGAPGRVQLPGGKVSWIRDDPTTVDLEVSSPAAASLVIADQFYPGWRAQIDGEPAEIARSNSVFRQIAVPAGSHRVSFRYLPASFLVGLYVALTSIAACLATLVCMRQLKPLSAIEGA